MENKSRVKIHPLDVPATPHRIIDSLKGEERETQWAGTFRQYYCKLFKCLPVSIWWEDFSEIKLYFDDLKKKGIRDFRGYLTKHPEQVLSLSRQVKIIEVNDATLKLYDAEGKEELYRGLNTIFSKESYDVFREELITLSAGKTEFQSEAINLTLTGEEKHILLKLIVVPGHEHTLSQVLVATIDITDMKRRGEDLRESEEKYRKIFESAHDAILVADVETGIILEANRKVQELIGEPPDKIVGMHFTQLHPKEETGRYNRIFAKHAESGKLVSDKLLMCNSKGEKIPVSISSSVICLGGKKCISVIFRQIKPAEKIEESEALRKLSRRECEILKLISSGLTTKEVAERLYISERTVQTHRARIMGKLNIHKSSDLVRYAMNCGLVE